MDQITLYLNGKPRQLAPCTVLQLLEQEQLVGKRVAVECNGELVPRSEHADYHLQSGDRLEFVVAVGGG